MSMLITSVEKATRIIHRLWCDPLQKVYIIIGMKTGQVICTGPWRSLTMITLDGVWDVDEYVDLQLLVQSIID